MDADDEDLPELVWDTDDEDGFGPMLAKLSRAPSSDSGNPRSAFNELCDTKVQVPNIPANSRVNQMDDKSYGALERCIAMAVESIQLVKQVHAHDHFSLANSLSVPAIQPLNTKVHNRSYLAPFPVVTPAQAFLKKSTGSLFSAAVRRVHVTPWPEQQIGKRHKALQHWRILIEENLSSTSLGKQLHELAVRASSDHSMAQTVEDTFAKKSTSTLLRRSACLMKYAIWHRKVTGMSFLPLTEPRCYEFAKQLQQFGAPTGPSSFTQAINFGLYVLQMEGAGIVSASERIKGVVYSAMKSKRHRKQSRNLLVDEVKSLEYQAQKSTCHFDSYACLFFLACLYTRSRFTGLCLADKLTVDLDEDDEGFLEFGTLHSKVHRSAEQLSMWLPLVAPATGITGYKWGRAFVDARKREGIDSFKYLLPTPGASGAWIDEPTEVGDASRWLCELLKQAGHDPTGIATHSLKSTPLSWAAKFLCPHDIRALLGYHIAKEVTSMMCYSRDAQAAPLAELIKIMSAIRSGEFCPDLTRSGRITVKKARADVIPNAQTVRVEQVITGEILTGCVHDPYVLVSPAPRPEPPSDSSSSSSSSNQSSEETDLPEEEIQFLRKVRLPNPEEIEEQIPYIHFRSGIVHAKRTEATKFNCKRTLSSSYSKRKWSDTAAFLRCAQCFRK